MHTPPNEHSHFSGILVSQAWPFPFYSIDRFQYPSSACRSVLWNRKGLACETSGILGTAFDVLILFLGWELPVIDIVIFPGSPCARMQSVLQATESWAGPGNEARKRGMM